MNAASELEDRLRDVVASVAAPRHGTEVIRAHLDSLTKPRGSLGRLEELALRLGRIYGDPPPPFEDVVAYVLAADHGVAARGVSAYPATVTAQMCANFAAGGAAINVLSRVVGARVVAVDVGVSVDLDHLDGVVPRKVRRGTGDLFEGPAMEREDALKAIMVGVELVTGGQGPGPGAEGPGAPPRPATPDLVVVGEMGIGNTTAASALTAALTGVSADRVVGPGTGVGPETLLRKREVVRGAVERVRGTADPLEVLRQVGGLELAAVAGVVLGAAARQRAVLIDGFVCTAGALVAAALCPASVDYMIASHRSPEPGHEVALQHLGLEPLLDLGMRLGEASGAALAVPLARAAAALLREMATFESARVSERNPAPPRSGTGAGGDGAAAPNGAASRPSAPGAA
jgi:nicotinate-nucleotide--dimethylbenzimidazole phosphoribosyltransferase